MCSVIAIQILDAVLFSSGNQNLPQSDQALTQVIMCTISLIVQGELAHPGAIQELVVRTAARHTVNWADAVAD